MKTLLLFAALLIGNAGKAQNAAVSNEDFVNAISGLIVDSSFAHYYLYVNAAPCSFKHFDYDEWYKYSLNEDVPFYILNEMAKKSFLDAAPRSWQEKKLVKAICIDEEKAKSMLERAVKRPVKNTDNNRNENKLVFYFSRPAFTDDYQYGVIDMGFRCDDRQCGMGATFLFKQVKGKWQPAGRKLAWGN